VDITDEKFAHKERGSKTGGATSPAQKQGFCLSRPKFTFNSQKASFKCISRPTVSVDNSLFQSAVVSFWHGYKDTAQLEVENAAGQFVERGCYD
jgi:hypothetical protein